MEIVGVVGDVHLTGIEAPVDPTIYVLTYGSSAMYVVVRTTSDPLTQVAAIRAKIWSLDRDLPIANVRTMKQRIDASVALPEFRTVLVTSFAAVALLLVMVGVYGVISYTVSQRSQEIGIRLALGARHDSILRLVVTRGLIITGAGLALGFAGAMALTRLMSDLLFEVSPTDPISFLRAAVLLTAVSLVAAYVTARRATKVDPLVALRSD